MVCETQSSKNNVW